MLYGLINVDTFVIVAQPVQRLPIHMLKDANVTHQYTVNDAIVNVTPYTQ